MSGLICRPELWDLDGVLHPFDMIGCLVVQKQNVSHAVISYREYINQQKLIPVWEQEVLRTYVHNNMNNKTMDLIRKTFLREKFKEAFVRMNTINLKVYYHYQNVHQRQSIPTQSDPLMICIWDYVPNRVSSKLDKNVSTDLLHHKISQFLLRRNIHSDKEQVMNHQEDVLVNISKTAYVYSGSLDLGTTRLLISEDGSNFYITILALLLLIILCEKIWIFHTRKYIY